MRYIDMTPAERLAKFNDLADAVEIHITGFVNRPYRGSFDDRKAANHSDKCGREMAFIERVARSQGDEWAQQKKLEKPSNPNPERNPT